MAIKCTSCGERIASSSIVYKCRQCVNHFVCQSCEKKEHNRAGILFHPLSEMVVPSSKSIASAAASSKTLNNNETLSSSTSSNSSIFASDDFLKMCIAYCCRCYRVFGAEKEISYQCQQCPNSYGVCSQCYPLVNTFHPSVHTFSKSPASTWEKVAHDYYHLGVTCDGCSLKSFNGKRYQCQECPPSYDLCENCFGKKHTHHQFKYIQNPVLYFNNQQTLALRTLALAEKSVDRNWRDPLTGWTKSDAEQVIQQAKKEIQSYEDEMREVNNRLKRDLEASQRRLEDSIEDSRRRMLWSLLN